MSHTSVTWDPPPPFKVFKGVRKAPFILFRCGNKRQSGVDLARSCSSTASGSHSNRLISKKSRGPRRKKLHLHTAKLHNFQGSSWENLGDDCFAVVASLRAQPQELAAGCGGAARRAVALLQLPKNVTVVGNRLFSVLKLEKKCEFLFQTKSVGSYRLLQVPIGCLSFYFVFLLFARIWNPQPNGPSQFGVDSRC